MTLGLLKDIQDILAAKKLEQGGCFLHKVAEREETGGRDMIDVTQQDESCRMTQRAAKGRDDVQARSVQVHWTRLGEIRAAGVGVGNRQQANVQGTLRACKQ